MGFTSLRGLSTSNNWSKAPAEPEFVVATSTVADPSYIGTHFLRINVSSFEDGSKSASVFVKDKDEDGNDVWGWIKVDSDLRIPDGQFEGEELAGLLRFIDPNSVQFQTWKRNPAYTGERHENMKQDSFTWRWLPGFADWCQSKQYAVVVPKDTRAYEKSSGDFTFIKVKLA